MKFIQARSLRHSLLATLFAVLVAPGSLLASTYVMTTDQELLDRSTVVVAGEVIGIERAPGSEPATDYFLQVSDVVKGFVPASTLLVRQRGGASDDGTVTVVWGAPVLRQGERLLLFLRGSDGGTFELVEGSLGTFRERAFQGRELLLRDMGDAHEIELPGDSQAQTRRRSHLPREREGFTNWLSARAEGQPAPADYFVEGPSSGLVPRYNLIESPTQNPPSGCGANGGFPIRAFEFDSGAGMKFVAHQGGQPGVANTTGSLKTSMAAWNSHGDSQVNILYNGTTSDTPPSGGTDGRNAILFEDPNGEIGGTFSGGGGTLAQTTTTFFCSVQNFSKGKAHPIAEADIVTQDGMQTWLAAGNANKRFEEVMAHELGHAIGLAHACNSSCSGAASKALMRATAHGDNRGASLGTDDKAAISFLYKKTGGGGGGGNQAPTAPDGLTATAISTSAIAVAWNDQSDNETSFVVEQRTATGDWLELSTHAAGTTSITVTGISSGSYRAYRVKARNSAGDSGYSNDEGATTDISPGSCTVDANTACLNADRFRVQMDFATVEAGNGTAIANELTADTGYFTFFNPDNVEVVIKVLNDCGGTTERYWVFAAGLTNVEVVITVADTQSGKVKTYVNPLNQKFAPVQDTNAFATCP